MLLYKKICLSSRLFTRRFGTMVQEQMVISSLTLIASKLSDVELVSMQELDLRPVSFKCGVNSHNIIAYGGWRNNGTLSSCTFQSNNGHQISCSSMKLRRYIFTIVSIRNQLISIREVGGHNTLETIEVIAITTWNK